MAYSRRPATEYQDVFASRSGDSNPAIEVQGEILLNHNFPNRPRGFNQLPKRLELRWVAGAHGLPQLSAVSQLPSGDTYNTATFLANQTADHYFEVLGTNAVSSTVAYSAEGGLKLTTTTGSADQVIILPHLTGIQSPWKQWTWGTDQQTSWEAHIKTGSAITSQVLWAGLKLTNTSVTATDDDQVMFRFAGGTDTNWQYIYSIGGTDVALDSGAAGLVVLSTEYHLKIAIDDSRVPRFYINGVLVGTGTALADAIDLIPYVGVQTSTAAAKHMYVFGQAISRAFA